MGRLVQLGQEEITPPPVYVPDVNIMLPDFYPTGVETETTPVFRTTAFANTPADPTAWVILALAALFVASESGKPGKARR